MGAHSCSLLLGSCLTTTLSSAIQVAASLTVFVCFSKVAFSTTRMVTLSKFDGPWPQHCQPHLLCPTAVVITQSNTSFASSSHSLHFGCLPPWECIIRPSGLFTNLPQKPSGAYHGLRIRQVNKYHQLCLLNKQTHVEMGPSCKIGNLGWLNPFITPPVHHVTNTGVRAALQRSRNGEWKPYHCWGSIGECVLVAEWGSDNSHLPSSSPLPCTSWTRVWGVRCGHMCTPEVQASSCLAPPPAHCVREWERQTCCLLPQVYPPNIHRCIGVVLFPHPPQFQEDCISSAQTCVYHMIHSQQTCGQRNEWTNEWMREWINWWLSTSIKHRLKHNFSLQVLQFMLENIVKFKITDEGSMFIFEKN